MGYTFLLGVGKQEDALSFLKQGIDANPSSVILNLALAESLELSANSASSDAKKPTIAEIHAEAAQQAQQKEAGRMQRDMHSRRRGPPPRERDHSSDGWSTVGTNAAPPPTRSGRGDLAFGKGLDRSGGRFGSGAGAPPRKCLIWPSTAAGDILTSRDFAGRGVADVRRNSGGGTGQQQLRREGRTGGRRPEQVPPESHGELP